MNAVEVLVVGAGQAGLAAGYWLHRVGIDFLLVDGVPRIGDSWRRRWDSLTLFTPAAHSALPGLALPGEPSHFPTKDEIADYLEAYACRFDLPVRLGDGVARLECHGGTFIATLASQTRIAARSVVVASGAFQIPAMPDVAAQVGAGVVQLTPNTYRSPAALPAASVLIVGDGATGRQIAAEVVTTRRVLLATGRRRHVTPARVLGRSVFWWLDRLGLLRAHRDSLFGRTLRERDPFPGRHLALGRLSDAGVVIRPRVASIDGADVAFADGSAERIGAIIWATGYRDDTHWIAVDGALDERGRIVESDGVSPIEGLYYVGRNWQRNRGSALLLGVGEDARLIVERAIDRVLQRRPVAARALANAS